MVKKENCIEQTEIVLSRSQERMRILREEKGLTKNQLAKEVGASATSIGNWESGLKVPSYTNYLTLSIFYGVSFDYISGIEPGEYRVKRNVDIGEVTHLSEKAIENIIYEGSEMGDNSRIVILDYILSDHDFFNNLMSEMYHLICPTYIMLDRKNPSASYLVHNEDGSINEDYLVITPETIKRLSNNAPEFIYQRMKVLVEEFIKTLPDAYIAPNEFNPF